MAAAFPINSRPDARQSAQSRAADRFPATGCEGLRAAVPVGHDHKRRWSCPCGLRSLRSLQRKFHPPCDLATSSLPRKTLPHFSKPKHGAGRRRLMFRADLMARANDPAPELIQSHQLLPQIRLPIWLFATKSPVAIVERCHRRLSFKRRMGYKIRVKPRPLPSERERGSGRSQLSK